MRVQAAWFEMLMYKGEESKLTRIVIGLAPVFTRQCARLPFGPLHDFEKYLAKKTKGSEGT